MLVNRLTVESPMHHHQVRHFPIVSAQGTLTGVMTHETIRQRLPMGAYTGRRL